VERWNPCGSKRRPRRSVSTLRGSTSLALSAPGPAWGRFFLPFTEKVSPCTVALDVSLEMAYFEFGGSFWGVVFLRSSIWTQILG